MNGIRRKLARQKLADELENVKAREVDSAENIDALAIALDEFNDCLGSGNVTRAMKPARDMLAAELKSCLEPDW